jgi:hypothetical protein
VAVEGLCELCGTLLGVWSVARACSVCVTAFVCDVLGRVAVLTLRFTILFSSSFYNMRVAQRGARRQTRVWRCVFEYLFLCLTSCCDLFVASDSEFSHSTVNIPKALTC